MEEMNAIESTAKIVEEKTLYKVLLILQECKTKEEAEQKIRTLLGE